MYYEMRSRYVLLKINFDLSRKIKFKLSSFLKTKTGNKRSNDKEIRVP